jgi:S-methylmethionine-dependent homocysteine/selenocysteine methylase
VNLTIGVSLLVSVGFLDGGVGQEIFQRAGKPRHPLWSVEVMMNQPEIVREVHSDYLNAGAKTLCLNTYTATPTRLKRAGVTHSIESIYSEANKALNTVREFSDTYFDVAGVLAPIEGSYLPSSPRSFQSMLDEFRLICALQPEVDLLMIETMSNSTEARAACLAAKETGKLFTLGIRVEADGLLRSGESVEDLLSAVKEFEPDGFWINCSAPEEVPTALEQIANPHKPYGAYANGFSSVEALAAGNSVAELMERKDLTPQQYAELALDWFNKGARLIGGCCAISPTHMQQTAEVLTHQGVQLVPVSQILQS